MYVKAEDELCFDKREKEEQDRHVFSKDKWITFQKFKEVRQEIKTGEDFVKTKTKFSSAILYRNMFCAILGFIIIDCIGILSIFYLLAKHSF